MPSSSKAQANLMNAVAADPVFAKKVGISQKVGQDFVDADKKKSRKKSRMNKMYPSMNQTVDDEGDGVD